MSATTPHPAHSLPTPNLPMPSPLLLCDNLISLAQQADRAG